MRVNCDFSNAVKNPCAARLKRQAAGSAAAEPKEADAENERGEARVRSALLHKRQLC